MPGAVLISVRDGDVNEELRYALRAWHARWPGVRVVTTGHQPGWLRTDHVPPPPRTTRSKAGVVTAQVAHALTVALLDQPRVWLADDDMFPLDDVPPAGPPLLHRETLREHVAGIRVESRYRLGLQATLRWLTLTGVADPWSFELHLPMPVEPHGYARVARQVIAADENMHPRSIWGNLHGRPTGRTDDVKVYEARDPLPDGPWVSTNDGTFRRGHVGRALRAMYPDASPWESHRPRRSRFASVTQSNSRHAR